MKISREAKEALARMVLELLVGNAIRLDRLSEDPSILCTGDNLHAIRKTRCVDSASWSRGSRCPKKTKRGRRQTSPFVGLRRGKGWPSVSPRRWLFFPSVAGKKVFLALSMDKAITRLSFTHKLKL